MSVRPQYRSRQFPEPAVLEWHQLARLGSPSGDVLAAFEIIPAVDVDLFPVSPKSAGSGSARRDRLNGSLKKKKRGRGLSACRADRDGARAEAAHDARHPRRHPPRHARHAHSGMAPRCMAALMHGPNPRAAPLLMSAAADPDLGPARSQEGRTAQRDAPARAFRMRRRGQGTRVHGAPAPMTEAPSPAPMEEAPRPARVCSLACSLSCSLACSIAGSIADEGPALRALVRRRPRSFCSTRTCPTSRRWRCGSTCGCR